ncbi:bactofilin family protein [Brumimicrobium mesophilum]|uniref:bactofilin family protein n=1 Tax=Brumimicrobium mesophilum TaxID=392717 RepID=UPI000D1419DE|nr:polymer-forming cytoskeletal protein [Brumimicrobium mesophilum]
MFKGDKSKSKPESPDRLNRLVSGTKVTGDLTATSSLRIDGEIVGNVNCDGKLVLGTEGVITGDIHAKEVELDGKVEGFINAELLLTLHQTASVVGDIQTGRIVIEDGAHIDGNIKTGEGNTGKKKSVEKLKKIAPKEKMEASELVY